MKRPEKYITICDHWEFFTYLPLDSGTVHVDIDRGSREYDIIMSMKYAGHLFVGEQDGHIDRIAFTLLGLRVATERMERGEDDGPPNETNIQLAEQWEKAFRKGKLPWQLGLDNPYQ